MHTVFSIKKLVIVSYFLGISVQALSHGYFLSQAKYATELLHKVGLTDRKPCSTPLAVKASSHSSSSDGLPFSNPSLYRSIVGGLQYLTITRPDLALVVNQACQHMHLPTNADFQVVKRLLRYVKGTLHHGLQFTSGPLFLHAFSDSNWAGDSVDRKSILGYCVYLGPNLISWSAKKQSIVSRSSTEAECRALANATAELTWLQQLLTDMHIPSSSIPKLWRDNLSAMALASNPVFHSRSKHIEIDWHFIRDEIVAKLIDWKYVRTTDQGIAKILTQLPQSQLEEEPKLQSQLELEKKSTLIPYLSQPCFTKFSYHFGMERGGWNPMFRRRREGIVGIQSNRFNDVDGLFTIFVDEIPNSMDPKRLFT
ncbi:uncharacterized protein LOC114286914 [Camellia sinensis]|uniref:uncharacterized protein LOC114286914 n=1 Tax=Camellia sinensis TaxID=4442 RepID=UPI001035CF19|nr:uncharacterized protein LOC114286914 [Camellia sinensis]